MRLVLDTDVVVAAMRSREGASWQLLDGALAGRFTLLMSVPLVLEYEAVLTREEHRKLHGLSVIEVTEVIDSLIHVSEAVKIRFLWRPLLADPNDDMVLETAVNGGADFLVTFNEGHYGAAAKGFAIRVVRPSLALRQWRAAATDRSREGES